MVAISRSAAASVPASTTSTVLLLKAILSFSCCWSIANAQPLQLAGGGYTAATNPINEANLALDAAAIKETDDLAAKKQIYNDGQTVSGRSLAKLSLEAKPLMEKDDMYNVYRFAFNYIGNVKEHEDLNHFDDKDVAEYGNTIVEDLFELDQEHIETDASLVTSVWMTVVHHLYEGMNECKAAATASGDDSLTGEADLDKAAAYWVGVNQDFGENEGGHMLYSIAEKAGARFGQDSIEAEVNTNILSLMNQIKTDIIETDSCKQADGYLQYRWIVNKIIAQMTVPLVQNLFHYSEEKNEKFLELYALALLPQISACSPTDFDWFLEELVMKDLNQQVFPDVVSRLQGLYPCLGITCQDVGSYKNGVIPQCSDSSADLPDIAGYKAERDVSETLKLDRDILRVRILTEWEAYDAAMDIYENGRNSIKDGSLVSLQSLATTDDRSDVPEFDWFKSYYNNDANYADTIILGALNPGDSTLQGASAVQRKEVVARALQTLVMPMYALQEMHTAVNLCSTDSKAAEDAWDRGAAAYVGSAEGSSPGGTDSGLSLYALGNELCSMFGTCGDASGSNVNAQMIDFFQRGKESLSDGSCAALPNPTLPASLVGDMKTIMVQGALHFAAVNDKLGSGSGQGSIGAGYACSRAILPYLNEANAAAAKTVDDNTKFSTETPVPDGVTAVFSAVAKSLQGMQIDCADVGVYASIANGDLCALADGTIVPDDTVQPPGPAPSPTEPSPNQQPVQSPTLPAPEPAGGQVDYTYSTTGKDAGKIALDVKEIVSSTDVTIARTVYDSGSNSDTSLSSLSSDASNRFGKDRFYNIFRYAFMDESFFLQGSTGGSVSDSSYANTVVDKALGIAEDTDLAADASVILNTWMEIEHQLEQAVASCTDSSIDGALAVDTAVAYYVGAEQIKGQDDSGYLMYSIAEKSAARFGQSSGEAPVNTIIMKLFNDVQKLVETCSTRDVELRRTVDKIISQMNVPLVRNLVYYMNAAIDDDTSAVTNFIELYALATVPQVAACNPGAFAYLRDELIDYDWDNDDVKDILTKVRENLSCFGITCADIGVLQDAVAQEQLCGGGSKAVTSLAGYDPTTDVSGIASIDRDILQIDILMRMGATQQAKAIYTGGQNSVKQGTDAYTTLQDMATDDDRNMATNTQFDKFSKYYSNPYYADSAIMDAFDKKGAFAGATDDQTRRFVSDALRGMVTYMHGLQELYTAIDECKSGTTDNGQSSWDRGAASLIGSIDGAKQTEDYASGGLLMYSLGNDVCSKFDKCSDTNVGMSSSKLVEYLTGGKLFLKDKECDSALDLVDVGITSSLEVSLIQGTLNAIAQMGSASSSDGIWGSGHALMSAIVPLVNDADSGSASTIESNMKFGSSLTNVNAVFDAFTDAVGSMDADCTDIGTYQATPARGVCPPDVVQADTSITLANGLYTTSTYVQDRALIALDLRDMEKALADGNTEVAQGIYDGGLNSDIYDKNGKKVGTRSLASFSTSAPLVMAQEPTYIMFKYALEDIGLGLYLGAPTGEYANSYVLKTFESQNRNDPLLPAEAARALNLWMYVVHELYQAVDNCKRKLVKDDDGVHSIDEVAAYYIGDSQQTGSAEEGHSLYAMTEKIGDIFGQDNNGQTVVNIKIVGLLNDAKNEISYPGACTTNTETYKRLRTLAHKIISQMTVPLIQNLIYNLVENDRERVRLYANAFVPLTAACEPSKFTFLRNKLMIEKYNVVDVDNIIRIIESTYQCLGLKCEDIGIFNDYGRDCVGTPELNPLAGYIPQTDVRKIAALDLDIQSINIFMRERAYDAVKDYYTLGRHASMTTRLGEQVFSLKDLATTSTRQIVPSYEYFKNYFGAEVDEIEEAGDYAHHIITRTLDTDQWPLASPEQRTEIVVKTAQYMVVYMAALEAMYEAIDDCKSNDSQRKANAANQWDKAAALLIGSLEGTESGGTKTGLMMYSLANKRCKQFNRCESDGTAQLNNQLVELLYSGRGETMGANCDALTKTTREIEVLLQVPLIQGTLRYAIANEKLLFFDKSKDLAEGYIFSHAVLPYVAEVDGQSAQVIKRNMDFQFDTEPVIDGTRKVFSAFATAIPRMGVDCEEVGSVDGIGGVCGTSASSHSRRTTLSLLASIVVSGVVICVSFL